MKNNKLITKRKELGLSQEELGGLLGVTKAAVSLWESGAIIPRGRNLISLCKILKRSPGWLLGNEEHSLTNKDFDSSGNEKTDNNVELAMFQEVALTDEEETYIVQKNEQIKYKLPEDILDIAGVDLGTAACARVPDESMNPILPKGSVIAVDTDINRLEDSQLYLIDVDGILKVRYLYRLPKKSLKLRSVNKESYPDEIYDQEDRESIEILGRVFWYSVILRN